MKEITLLFSTYRCFSAKLLKVLTRSKYSHVALSIENKDEFFSFNRHGFVKEKHSAPLNKYKKTVTLKVTDESYRKLKAMMDSFIEKRQNFKYARMGIVLSLLHIPFHRTNKYFCSEFVAELLQRANVLVTKKNSALYLPAELERLYRNNSQEVH